MADFHPGARGGMKLQFPGAGNPGSDEIDPKYRGREYYIQYSMETGIVRAYRDGAFIERLSGTTRDWVFRQIDPDYRPLAEMENKIQEDYIPEIVKVDAVVRLRFPDDIDSPYRGQERYVLIMPAEDGKKKIVRLLPEMDGLGENLGDDLTEFAVRSFMDTDSRK